MLTNLGLGLSSTLSVRSGYLDQHEFQQVYSNLEGIDISQASSFLLLADVQISPVLVLFGPKELQILLHKVSKDLDFSHRRSTVGKVVSARFAAFRPTSQVNETKFRILFQEAAPASGPL